MTLTNLIISLNGQYILGKDSKSYVIEIPSKNTIGTIYISDAEDRSRNGFIPDLRGLGDTLYQAGVAEFMRVSNQGIYKSLIRMISEIVPAGTKYKSSIFNPQDQDALLDYVKERDTLDLRDALEETCFGHILQASEFSNVQLFYKDQNGINEGIEALQRFNEDRENGIYTSLHETDLFLIGTKQNNHCSTSRPIGRVQLGRADRRRSLETSEHNESNIKGNFSCGSQFEIL